jgi:urease accessory protein
MTGSVFNAFLLADARLPTGSHSDSAGLEPAVIGGLKAADIYPYMLARLHTLVRLEAGACVLAHRLASEDAPMAQYARLEAAVDARTPSAAQRSASRSLGRALLRLARALRPDHAGIAALGDLVTPPMRAVALGVIGNALAVEEEHCAQICCYEDLQRVAAAALKLLPVDPTAVTRWVLDAGDSVTEVVRTARSVRDCSELPALSAPWMEYWAEEHTQRTRRLFVA